jgi:capsular exopolysaccharide synthesis family protein
VQQPTQPDAAIEAEKLRSTAVAQAAVTQAGGGLTADEALGHVSAGFAQNRNVLDVIYSSEDPTQARDMANAFAAAYAAQREGAANAYYDSELKRLNDEFTTLTGRLTTAQGQIDSRRTDLDRLDRINPQTSETITTRRSIQSEIDSLEVQRQSDLARSIQVRNDIADLQRNRDNRTKSAEVIRQAGVPSTPTGVSDNSVRLGGLFLGLLAGVLLAFTLSRLDRSASDQGDVEEAVGAPVLANVPSFRWNRARGVNALVMVSNSRSLRLQRSREAYRRLRTSMQLMSTRTGRNSIIITSAHPNEGKSVTATNLAVANAQAGKRTVLVSADLRRPSIERLLSVPNDKGLSDWLAEETEAVVQELPSIPNLAVVVAGNQLDGPGELLASGRLDTLVLDLEAEYDLVIVDTPPVLATADAATIAHCVGGVIIVVDGRRTDLEVLRLITAELQRAGGRIAGAVLNRTRTEPGRSLLRRDTYAYEREARRRLD